MKIDRVWCGDFTVGERILIEDEVYSYKSSYFMLEGHSYVIPLRCVGDTVDLRHYKPEELIEGNVTRDGIYSTGYIYHPQIERTVDGLYLVPDDWSILRDGGIPVINEPRDPEEKVDFYKRSYDFFIHYPDSFEEKMNEFIASR